MIPFVTFCHLWGIFELSGYLICFQITVEGCRMGISEELGIWGMNFMIALTGQALACVVFRYSFILHTNRIRDIMAGKENKSKVFKI